MEEINHPDRYAGGKYECIEVMVDIFGVEVVKNFCVLNAFKYLWRHKQKGGTEDIKKAVWYLNEYIKLDETVPSVMVNRPVKTVGEALDEYYGKSENSDIPEKEPAKAPATVESSDKMPRYVSYSYDKELGLNIPVPVDCIPETEKTEEFWAN